MSFPKGSKMIRAEHQGHATRSVDRKVCKHFPTKSKSLKGKLFKPPEYIPAKAALSNLLVEK